jgi:preprotein translocase subunit SecG
MTTAVLIIHILIIIAMIGVILIQRSEGGGLGMGSAGGLMGARGASDFLTRTTAILATLFFVTSITLALLAKGASVKERSILALEDNEAAGGASALVQSPAEDSVLSKESAKEEEAEDTSAEGQKIAPVDVDEETEASTATAAEPIIEAPVASDE